MHDFSERMIIKEFGFYLSQIDFLIIVWYNNNINSNRGVQGFAPFL